MGVTFIPDLLQVSTLIPSTIAQFYDGSELNFWKLHAREEAAKNKSLLFLQYLCLARSILYFMIYVGIGSLSICRYWGT